MALTVFRGPSILTMDAARPRAEAIAFDGSEILEVGDAAIVSHYPQAEIIELGERTLVPGFIDAHAHLCIEALHPRWADLSAVGDLDGLRQGLLAQAAAEPSADWVRGVGWSDLDGGFLPTRGDLDELGLDRPVIVVHYSYHQCVVSSSGLDSLGLSSTAPDPPGGAIGRSPDGTPNGVLVERAFSEAHARSMEPYRDPDRWADHVISRARQLLAEGVTCVHDAACPPSAERLYERLARERRLPVSILAMPHAEALLAPLDAARLDGPTTGEGDPRFRIGPVKLFADGGVLPAISGTVHGHPVSLGLVFGDLEAQVGSVTDRGFRVAVHAIGNRGVDAALDAFEAASRSHPHDDHRFRMEHATLLGARQAKRMFGLGALGVVQPGFVHHLGGAVDGFDLDGMAWLPFAEMDRSGVPLAASSDSPCAFSQPLLTSALGVTRLTSKNTVIDQDQSLPYETWLRAYTAGAAFAGGQEHERGRLAPGLLSDMVVLDGQLDPYHPPRVAETWVSGERVFQAPPGAGTSRPAGTSA